MQHRNFIITLMIFIFILQTVFSAPHYMQSFTNSAAVCKVSAGLEVSFEVLKPEDIRVEEIKCSAESSCASDMQQ